LAVIRQTGKEAPDRGIDGRFRSGKDHGKALAERMGCLFTTPTISTARQRRQMAAGSRGATMTVGHGRTIGRNGGDQRARRQRDTAFG
jgi:hypothetical protein